MIRRFSIAFLMLLALIPLCEASAQEPFSRIADWVKRLTDAVIEFLNVLKSSAITIGRVMAGTVIAIGVVLWGSEIFSYKGKRLILAGLITLMIIEAISAI